MSWHMHNITVDIYSRYIFLKSDKFATYIIRAKRKYRRKGRSRGSWSRRNDRKRWNTRKRRNSSAKRTKRWKRWEDELVFCLTCFLVAKKMLQTFRDVLEHWTWNIKSLYKYYAATYSSLFGTELSSISIVFSTGKQAKLSDIQSCFLTFDLPHLHTLSNDAPA